MKLRRSNPRRGLTLIPSLVCLVVATALCAVLLRQAHTERVMVKSLERNEQAQWLAESGLARALARLAADRSYQGETWKLPAEALGGQLAGEVRITVTTENPSTKRKVRVEADYPVDADARTRQSRTQIVELGPDPSKGPT